MLSSMLRGWLTAVGSALAASGALAEAPLHASTDHASDLTDAMQQLLLAILLILLVWSGALRGKADRGPQGIVVGGIIGGIAWCVSGLVWLGAVAGIIGLLFTLVDEAPTGWRSADGLGSFDGDYRRDGFGGGGATDAHVTAHSIA